VGKAHSLPLCDVVQERRPEQLWVVMSAAQQALRDVEAVAPIRDGHRLEQPDSTVGENAAHEGDLLGVDAGTDVRDELADPMHR
jgi:hypothetical protein